MLDQVVALPCIYCFPELPQSKCKQGVFQLGLVMRITIVGHSQLPRDNGHFDGHQVRWIKRGGADLRDLGGVDRRLGLNFNSTPGYYVFLG